ncbi:MAG: hypothetical protein HC774_08145, partial [Sphingomonadales bacterium]|nr:hypothetical protein [Sphingomonadales bacterium]
MLVLPGGLVGGLKRIEAETEVIVTAGAIGSPKLLMLSGVGPSKHLNEVGVPVLHDLPGVGRNLHDHFSTDVTWVLNGAHSYDKYKKKRWQLWAGIQYMAFRTGPVASNIVEAGAFWWSDRKEKTPDLQFHFRQGIRWGDFVPLWEEGFRLPDGPRSLAEAEAECVALLCCEALGLPGRRGGARLHPAL